MCAICGIINFDGKPVPRAELAGMRDVMKNRGPEPAPERDEKLDYTLGIESAMPTFQRFLNHLWEMTKPAPLPADMRSPENPFDAPILLAQTHHTKLAE